MKQQIAKPDSTVLDGTNEIIPCGYACEALSFLQQIYHSAPVGMLALDMNCHIIRVNNRLAEFAARDIDDCPGIAVHEFIAEISAFFSSLAKKVLQTSTPETDRILSFIRYGQQYCWSVSAYPVNYEAAHSHAVSFIIHDISELKNTQLRLEKALAEISELQEKLKQENQLLRSEIGDETATPIIIGSSPALLRVMHQLHKVAPTDATVMITGDTGTGKELAAREIHRHSRRSQQPIVIVNCAAMPANLIESELFGHEKGAFTGAISRKIGRFEVADGGTVFLDEIGEMPLELQSKLLRVLQENQIERIGSNKQISIDVRVIAATNRDLKKEVNAGRFREDLFFRLNVFPVHLPPLKDRENDILEIARNFMKKFALKQGKRIADLSPTACRSLMSYSWPGNIRELGNVIERAVILCQSDTLEIDYPGNTSLQPKEADRNSNSNLQSLHEVEKIHILQVLHATSWRVRGVGGAAEILGLKPTTLESRMLKLGIKRATSR
jgi:PAS domain S-box-containing protein